MLFDVKFTPFKLLFYFFILLQHVVKHLHRSIFMLCTWLASLIHTNKNDNITLLLTSQSLPGQTSGMKSWSKRWEKGPWPCWEGSEHYNHAPKQQVSIYMYTSTILMVAYRYLGHGKAQQSLHTALPVVWSVLVVSHSVFPPSCQQGSRHYQITK